MLLHRWSEGI